MWLSSLLDRFDDRQAVRNASKSHAVGMSLGASMAFGDAKKGDSFSEFANLVQLHQLDARSFYSARIATEYRFVDGLLSFQSAIATDEACNNVVWCRVYEASGSKHAAVLLPHWDAPLWAYERFGRYLRRLGLTVVELCLPYHGMRSGEEGVGPDCFLSANLGRTIRSVRQAVLDSRGVLDWLSGRGYETLGVIGISLGSCVAALVAAHDARVRTSALLLTAGDFSEVIWTGAATRHIKQAFAPSLTLEQLREIWSIISPESFVNDLARNDHAALILSGTRDHVVAPHLTARFVTELRTSGATVTWRTLSCGHYSLALFPFSALAFLALVRFLMRRGMIRSLSPRSYLQRVP